LLERQIKEIKEMVNLKSPKHIHEKRLLQFANLARSNEIFA
jgi:hypothetical protein